MKLGSVKSFTVTGNIKTVSNFGEAFVVVLVNICISSLDQASDQKRKIGKDPKHRFVIVELTSKLTSFALEKKKKKTRVLFIKFTRV